MKIAIDISEEIVKWINDYFDIIRVLNGEKVGIIVDAIKNGTPLPKVQERSIIFVDCAHRCENCKHVILPANVEPCSSCSIQTMDMTDFIDNFEPNEEIMNEAGAEEKELDSLEERTMSFGKVESEATENESNC